MAALSKVLLQSQFVRWIKGGVVVATIITAVLATMVLAASNSAQSAQAKAYRAQSAELRALERHLPHGGSHSPYQPAL